MSKKTFSIFDWTGKRLFNGLTKPTFEEAWEYVLSQYVGNHMELVPVTIDQLKHIREEGSPQYLVRIGRMVFLASCMPPDADGMAFYHEGELINVDRADEILEVKLS